MSSDIVIKVEGLSKCYQIYANPLDRLMQFVLPRLRQFIGLQVKQYFREFWALKNVTFEIKRGETIGIIGRNGSGKSTLLQIICGILNATNGTTKTTGRIAALLELGSGFNPEFTGRENIYLNGAILGLTKEEIDSKYNDIIAFADIGEFINQPVKIYSSGMTMRLAFSVIAHVDADILIVDEALSVGDSVFIQKCNRFLRQFKKNGTLLFVSHSMQSVLDLCDRAIWLKDGHVQMDSVAKNVVRNYNAYSHQQINIDQEIGVTEAESTTVNSPSTLYTELVNEQIAAYSAVAHPFDINTPYWGGGGALVLNIELLDSDMKKIVTVSGCGFITVRIHCKALQILEYPIVGFVLRNQRGVEIISENTDLGYMATQPPTIEPEYEFHVDFDVFIPFLPTGDYFIGAAVADRPNSSATHIQHHRRDDALRFSVVASHVFFGLVSMPIRTCSITLK